MDRWVAIGLLNSISVSFPLLVPISCISRVVRVRTWRFYLYPRSLLSGVLSAHCFVTFFVSFSKDWDCVYVVPGDARCIITVHAFCYIQMYIFKMTKDSLSDFNLTHR